MTTYDILRMNCVICLEPVQINYLHLNCGQCHHRVHIQCSNQWNIARRNQGLQAVTPCPYCRSYGYQYYDSLSAVWNRTSHNSRPNNVATSIASSGLARPENNRNRSPRSLLTSLFSESIVVPLNHNIYAKDCTRLACPCFTAAGSVTAGTATRLTRNIGSYSRVCPIECSCTSYQWY